MRAEILDGKELSEKILRNLGREIKKFKLRLTLAVIQVGENSVSQIFINKKKEACEKIGISFKLFKFTARIKTPELNKKIKKIIRSPNNSGVVIQLPLPKKFIPEKILNLIPEEKDVDVLSEKSLGKFYQGTLRILPPTVAGILFLLKNYKIRLKEKNIVIVGAGRLVGLPLAIKLLKEKATLSVLNKWAKDVSSFTGKADILISAVGKPRLIKDRMVKKGAVVVDAGTSVKNGKLRGDVDFKSVSKRAKHITPVPGGVGPMTVVCLIENLIKLSKKR